MTVIAVKVVPRAAQDEIVGWLDGALKVRVMAPPQDGRANRALEELLASALRLKKNAVDCRRRLDLGAQARGDRGPDCATRSFGGSSSLRCGHPALPGLSAASTAHDIVRPR